MATAPRKKTTAKKAVKEKKILSKTLVFNWKMNPASFKEAQAIFEYLKAESSKSRNTLIVACAPAIYLKSLRDAYRGEKIKFGVQDAFPEDSGAWTGEVSFLQAKNLGATHALINHSERKKRGEDRSIAKAKLESALRNGLYPILCIGEEARDESGQYLKDVQEELSFFLKSLANEKRSQIVVAYEPIWAIGKKGSEAITPHDLHEMSLYMRKILIEMFGRKEGYQIPIIYGGSVDDANCQSLIETGEISGFLPGRASLNKEGIAGIINCLERHG